MAEHINITHYKDIQNIKVYERQKPVLNKIDKILMWGGGGYIFLNTVNSIGKGDYTSQGNLKKLAMAGGVLGAGLLINRFFGVNNFSREGYKIVYLDMN